MNCSMNFDHSYRTDSGRRGARSVVQAITLIAIIPAYLGAAHAALAQTAETQTSEQNVDATIAELETVIARATKTLIELKKQQARINGAPSASIAAPFLPQPSLTGIQPKTASANPNLPKGMPACDASGASGSIGSYMLALNGRDKQKKEASLDEREAGTDEGINAFVYHCLGLKRATDYENTTKLSAQFVASKGSDQIEAMVSRTARALKAAGDDGSSRVAVYNKYSLGGFGRTGTDGSALLIDLTESNFASGVGIVAGFEWGRMPATATSKLETKIHKGIAKARQDCVATHSIIDPLTSEPSISGARPQMALNPLLACEGEGLRAWMSDTERSNRYWNDIVAPIWGYDGKPETFAGVQFRYAFQDLKYRPVIDPNTGAVIATTLPEAITIHPEPYSLKLYGGFNRPMKFRGDKKGDIGLTGSLTYRREVDFIAGTSGKIICTPAAVGATFDFCSTDQRLAAPYDTEGFVGGVALNLQADRFWYLPKIAVSPRLTYAFDTNRFGLEVPFFLFTDSEGKLNSGVQYTCRFRGQTTEGLELKKTCGVNLFVGTSFEIGKFP